MVVEEICEVGATLAPIKRYLTTLKNTTFVNVTSFADKNTMTEPNLYLFFDIMVEIGEILDVSMFNTVRI
jgi:hypoxanthine-guanine phosphoribosyltransferase